MEQKLIEFQTLSDDFNDFVQSLSIHSGLSELSELIAYFKRLYNSYQQLLINQ